MATASSQVGGVRTYVAGGAIGADLRVKLTSGKLAVAGSTDVEIGVIATAAFADLDERPVTLRNAQGTVLMVASEAITLGATVYAAASGKVAASGTVAIGTAQIAASANNDVIEVLRFGQSDVSSIVVTRTVAAKTADYTVVAATDSGKTFSTVGASGTVTFALPAATTGQNYRFRVGAAQELRLDPNGSETVALPSTGVQGAAGKYLTANADGETVEIECTKAGQWSVFGFTGTWTAEA